MPGQWGGCRNGSGCIGPRHISTAASTTPGQARGADRANQVLAIQAQGHQEGAALTHRQALLCC